MTTETLHLLCLRDVTECWCFGEPHDQAGHDAIAAELVRATLAGDHRPELVFDPPSGG